MSETFSSYNIKELIDNTKKVSNMLSIPPHKLNIVSDNKAMYESNNLLWEAVKHPTSQRWYLTGKSENKDE